MSEPDPAADALKIRPARASDRDAILGFSRNTWQWGDYLEHVWDDWLGSSEGRLLVGEVAGRPIAVGRGRLVAPGQGWLEGLRVDPSVRRTGVGHAMTVATLGVARDLGAEVVRFATRADAFPVHRIGERLGFQKVAAYRVLYAARLEDDGEHLRPLERSAEGSALRLVSDTWTGEGAPLTWQHWHCRTLDVDEISRRLRAGWAYALQTGAGADEGLGSLALAADDAEERELVVDYFTTRDEADLAYLGRALRRLAAARGLDHVSARVPDAPAKLAAMADAGYESSYGDAPYWVFEWHASRGLELPAA